jgi:hypothetical protein
MSFSSRILPAKEVAKFTRRMKSLGFDLVASRNTADGKVVVTFQCTNAFSRVGSLGREEDDAVRQTA